MIKRTYRIDGYRIKAASSREAQLIAKSLAAAGVRRPLRLWRIGAYVWSGCSAAWLAIHLTTGLTAALDLALACAAMGVCWLWIDRAGD